MKRDKTGNRRTTRIPRAGEFFRNLSPANLILIGYVGTILTGTLLLLLPSMVTPGNTLSFIDALFTSTSAVCVTGLIVVDTATFYTFWGQLVILLLFQAGGLGYMSLTTVLALAFRRRIEYRDRLAIKESLSQESPGGVVRFTITILKYTLIVEGVGALLLFFAFLRYLPPGRALFTAVFHAVSAFCNAGFSIFTDSLEGFVLDPYIILVMVGLIILGGLGFIVIAEIIRNKRAHTLHARVVLRTTMILIAAGFCIILLFEWNNPDTLGALPVGGRLLAGLFHSVTPRTAGFNTISVNLFYPSTLLVTMFLMFIGASPGGTGGGVKTTVFTILVGFVHSALRGKKTLEICNRRIPQLTANRAISLVVVASLYVLGVVVAIMLIQPFTPIDTLFEVVSAFGTVGLSTGVTAELLSLNKFLIIITMYIGRVGFFSLLMLRWHRRPYDYLVYPEENLPV